MTAEEARQKTKETIVKQIESGIMYEVKSGKTEATFLFRIDDDIVSELKENGYIVEYVQEGSHTNISWSTPPSQ